jgi:hypothetical protein
MLGDVFSSPAAHLRRFGIQPVVRCYGIPALASRSNHAYSGSFA